MQPYANAGGDSNVVAYDVTDSGIVVRFRTGAQRHYEYTDASCGPDAVSQMVALARAGQGLNSYIGRTRPAYARKW